MTEHSSNILQNRIAIVTGASAGIGNAIACNLASNGAHVVVNARRQDKLKEIETRFNKNGTRICSVVGDVSNQKVIDSMLDKAKSAFGSEANIIVVNAGRGLSGSILSSDTSQWEEMININLLGCLRLLRSSCEKLLAHISDHKSLEHSYDIVVLGSTVGRHISPFSSVYGSTKFAVNSLAEALRRELGPKGIRVTLIEPGIVASEFQKVAGYDQKWFDEFAIKFGPLIQPDDVAKLITFVVSQPPHIHLSDVVIRPTRQDYP